MTQDKIIEMAKQAGYSVDVFGFGIWDSAEFNRFAELIIKECLDQCYNKGMNDTLYEGQLKAASYIEQHFGVKE
jgi:hypothetical protein